MGLIDDMGLGPVGIDTCVFIYYIEENQENLDLVEPIFQAIDAGKLLAITSTLTLLETLFVPYRNGDFELAKAYEAILLQSGGLHVVDLSLPILRAAAAIRAKTHLRTPDALQVATAISQNCSAFVTNDRDLPLDVGLPVIQLRDYTIRTL